ncbi:MAG: hypothetical protein CBB87_08375 [Micavibrio sp. TMED27]|nr:hypothetical protein [Micavibrio sp.]OUT90684.1 MAG: hypothetical protein CBB87_08375 [Micavibrio sp. TMED27]
MSDQKKFKINPMKIFWKLFKLTLILAVLLFILLTVLANLGGKSEMMKTTLEEIISEQTGYDSRIETLNYMGYFPDMGADLNGLALTPTIETDYVGDPVIKIGYMSVALSAWDIFFQNIKFRALTLHDIVIKKDVLIGAPIKIDYFVLGQPKDEEAALRVEGIVGSTPLVAKLNAELKGRYFSLADESNISIKLGNIDIKATASLSEKGGIELKNIILKKADKGVVLGDVYVVHDNANDAFEIHAQLKTPSKQTDLDIMLSLSNTDSSKTIKGKINSKLLQISELSGDSDIVQLINEISNILYPEKKAEAPLDLSAIDMDVDMDIKGLKSGDFLIGSVKTPLKIKGSKLSMKPVSGKISKGDLSGSISLNANEGKSKLAIDLLVKDLDYGAAQKQFMENAELEGKAALALKLNSEAKLTSNLMKNIEGNLSFIGGEGEMRSSILDLWGGGIVNAIIPSLKANAKIDVNCAVMDINIASEKANMNTILLDTRRVKLQGKGDYDIAKDKLDIKLSPKTKDVSIGDISTGVIVSGSITNPKFKPSAVDIGKKVGSALLSAVNPAFLALSVVDVGLTDQNPCASHLTLTKPKSDNP